MKSKENKTSLSDQEFKREEANHEQPESDESEKFNVFLEKARDYAYNDPSKKSFEEILELVGRAREEQIGADSINVLIDYFKQHGVADWDSGLRKMPQEMIQKILEGKGDQVEGASLVGTLETQPQNYCIKILQGG